MNKRLLNVWSGCISVPCVYILVLSWHRLRSYSSQRQNLEVDHCLYERVVHKPLIHSSHQSEAEDLWIRCMFIVYLHKHTSQAQVLVRFLLWNYNLKDHAILGEGFLEQVLRDRKGQVANNETKLLHQLARQQSQSNRDRDHNSAYGWIEEPHFDVGHSKPVADVL